MTDFLLPINYPQVQRVNSFHELVTTPFAHRVNALCWPRTLAGDFGEVVKLLGRSEGIHLLDETELLRLPVSAAGRGAVEAMLADFRLLRDQGLDPALNCILGYPRDESPGPVATDVFSFHVDSAPVAADTYLCTYHGAPSDGLANEDAVRKVDLPVTRAELLKQFGGVDDAAFREHLNEQCYDLHYALVAGAKPFSFGVGNLWRIATEWPGNPVPPCVHRAPETAPGESRLLLIC